MANSARGAGNPLVPIGIIAAVVAAILIGVFAIRDDAPPDEPTVIADDSIEAEPAGAGTTPEGEADEAEEGITEQVDDVETPTGEQVPAASRVDTSGDDVEGETSADEETAGTADTEGETEDAGEQEEVGGMTTMEASEAGGADGEQPANAEAGDAEGTEEDFDLIEESADANAPEGEVSSTDNPEALPEGRDAETELTPEEDQDVVRDPDQGGAAFVPTPSGPEGRDDETIAD